MLIFGLGLFMFGAELSVTMIGAHIGTTLIRSRKLTLIILLGLVFGISITVAEPDLQVLAGNMPAIDSVVFIATVSIGVGIFLVVSMLRIVLRIPLKWLLIICYSAVFALVFISDPHFTPVAFDAGGVTTGPMTAPFIMALGVGVASMRSDKHAKTDSFGLVALCSIGPMLSVLILGLVYPAEGSSAFDYTLRVYESTVDVGRDYIIGIFECIREVALALLPIFVFFVVFQIASFRFKKQLFVRIIIGLLYTYVGLVFFLAGDNVAFSQLGYVLGNSIIEENMSWCLVPVSALMGWFIIKAEPTVHVLDRQVAELSAGAFSGNVMEHTLSVAVAAATGLAMTGVLAGIPIMYFIVPGYIAAIILSFFAPPTFTSIAFDAGGVASGPMTATFMLPFAVGACRALGGDVMADAFGIVAMVAMMPPVVVQIMGLLAKSKSAKPEKVLSADYGDDEIIELWEI